MNRISSLKLLSKNASASAGEDLRAMTICLGISLIGAVCMLATAVRMKPPQSPHLAE